MGALGGTRCFLSGGEPTVELTDRGERGKGGRNQQLILAALEQFLGGPYPPSFRLAMLSGGTDGEDGPTDAAGAVIDGDLLSSLFAADMDVSDYLRRNDAYHIFGPLGCLLRTGPTHTNVCDVRVLLTSAEDVLRHGPR